MRHTDYITYSDILAFFMGLAFTILTLGSLIVNLSRMIH